MVQVAAVPELAHAPPQPANVEGAVTAAVRVTIVPLVYFGVQVPVTTPLASVQLASDRLSVTLPLPVPRSLMVRAGPLPVPLPAQPPKIEVHTRMVDMESHAVRSFMVLPL